MVDILKPKEMFDSIDYAIPSDRWENVPPDLSDGKFAYKVVTCRIPGNNFSDEGFTPAALGAPDNINFSIGKNGYCILGMQQPISDGPGNDIIIYESGRGHRAGDSHATEFVWSISQQLFNSQVMAMFTGSYNPIGKYFLCPILSYAPGRHWRWELALPIYGSTTSTNMGLYDKDSILFRIRYEF